MNDALNWFLNHKLELAGTISGFIYIFLSIRASIWLWFVGFITSAAYIFVFYQSGFYADMALQIYYIIISVYGWIRWRYYKADISEERPVVYSTAQQHVIYLSLTILGTLAIGYFLDTYTNSSVPYQDAFTTAGSIVGTYMLTEKQIDNWIYWIIVDAYSVYLYAQKDLYSTAILYTVYTCMAFIGYVQWRKKMNPALLA